MIEIKQLQKLILKKFSNSRAVLDKPLQKTGVWALDIFLPDYHLAIAWQAGKGFGLVSDDAHGYGEGADEVYESLESVLPRIIELLEKKQSTQSPLGPRKALLGKSFGARFEGQDE